MPVAYLDEVGLGAAFGELVACAVILPEGYKNRKIRDSKQLRHEVIYAIAKELAPLTHAFGVVYPDELNVMRNMFNADKLAMMRAIKGLPEMPTVLFIDGKIKLELGIDCVSIVKGDQKILGIAAASILAKSFRDHYIINKYGKEYSSYDIINNKGYRSPRHFRAIRKYGVTDYHRKWMPQIQRLLMENP